MIKSNELIEYRRVYLIYNDFIISDKFPINYKTEKINHYLRSFKRKGFILSYYLLVFSKFELEYLAYGVDNLVEFYLQRENIINNLPNVVRQAYFSALLNLLPRKGYIRKAKEILKKVINSYKKLKTNDKYVIYDYRTTISASFFSIGDYKSSLSWAIEGSEIHMFSIFMIGNYQEVIEKNFEKNFISKNWNIQGLVSLFYIILSFLMLDKINEANYIFKNFEENYSKLGYLKPSIYIYYLIYYAKLKDKENFQKTFREAVNEGMENKERDFYRILCYSTYHEKTIKFLIEGKLELAQKLVNEYGTKFFYDLYHILTD